MSIGSYFSIRYLRNAHLYSSVIKCEGHLVNEIFVSNLLNFVRLLTPVLKTSCVFDA